MIIGEDSMEKGEREKEGNGYGSIKPTITIRTDEPSTNPFKKSVSLENLYRNPYKPSYTKLNIVKI